MRRKRSNTIVGVWEVNAPDAPFPWHMMTFTPHGTMSQSNPHEGNQEESDSGGQGLWWASQMPGGKVRVKGKFVEFKAERTSGKYIGKGVITFTVILHGNSFVGTSDAYRYDAAGELMNGPLPSRMSGTRLTLTDI